MNLDNKNILLTGCGGPAGVNFLKSVKDMPETEQTRFYGSDIKLEHLYLAKTYLSKNENGDIGGFIVPRADDPNYIPVLKNIIKEFKIDFIHPQPDFEVKYISKHRDELGCKTFLPAKDVVAICQDKFISAKIWDKAEIPSVKPVEIELCHLNTDLEYAFRIFGNRGFWLRATEGAGGRGSTFCLNTSVAKHWIMYWQSRGVECEWMAQEYLPGRNIAWQGIFKDGDLIVSQCRERLEYIYAYLAPSGITGTPAIACTIKGEAINLMAMKAILAIDKKPNGIYAMDMKGNQEGIIVPTEINPGRFHTTSYFYAHAAKSFNLPRANMVMTYLKAAFDDPIDDGEKFDILPADLLWLRHIDCPTVLVKGVDLYGKEN